MPTSCIHIYIYVLPTARRAVSSKGLTAKGLALPSPLPSAESGRKKATRKSKGKASEAEEEEDDDAGWGPKDGEEEEEGSDEDSRGDEDGDGDGDEEAGSEADQGDAGAEEEERGSSDAAMDEEEDAPEEEEAAEEDDEEEEEQDEDETLASKPHAEGAARRARLPKKAGRCAEGVALAPPALNTPRPTERGPSGPRQLDARRSSAPASLPGAVLRPHCRALSLPPSPHQAGGENHSPQVVRRGKAAAKAQPKRAATGGASSKQAKKTRG